MNRRLTLGERQRLHVVAGWLSLLLARLSFDLGDSAFAKVHCRTALQLAEEAGEPNLAAWTRATQALIAIYAGQPPDAVDLASAGRRVAPLGSAAAVQGAGLEARAWARLGDQQGFEAAMAGAERAFGELSEPPTGTVFTVGAPNVSSYAGTAYVWLGQPARARECCARSIEMCDADPGAWFVTPVQARIDIGLALTQDRDIEGACSIGVEAIDLSRERPVDQIRRRAGELWTALQPFGKLPIVRDFDERYRAVFASPG